MAPYQYSKLVDEARDIRLITLLPGKVDDDIEFTITYTPLIKPAERHTQRLSLKQVQETLPLGWDVYETTEGRYLFERLETEQTSWAHPLSHIDRFSYELPPEDAEPDFSPKYEALSYTWGTKDSPETAYVTESPSDELSTLQIQQNLASGLRHLRHHDSPRTLWVDAVCINQHDIPERNTQVTRMTDIYRQAYRVVVWLGLESSNSKLAIRTLDYLGLQAETLKDNGRGSSTNSSHRDWYRSRCELPYNQATWQAILDMLNRPWFDRLWVTQEILLANHRAIMQCGHDEICWTRFRRGQVCISTKRTLPSREFSDRALEVQIMMRYFPAYNFYALLRMAANRLCSDPRDKVYGLLGLASQKVTAAIRPQYSLPVSTVYRDTILLLLDQTQRLDALHLCNWKMNQEQHFPSWIADWSRPTTYDRSASTTMVAAGISSARASFIPPDILEVDGVHCATVSAVYEPILKNPVQSSDVIRQWGPAHLQNGLYPTGESYSDAFATTIIRNLLRERFPTYSSYATLQEWEKKVFSGGEAKSSRILQYTQNSAFVVTEEGYIGLSTLDTKPGGIVCTILGCSLTIVLRQVRMSTYRYHVIGSSYLHGFCDGTALLGPLPLPWKVQLKRDSSGYTNPYFHNPTTGENSDRDPRLETIQLPPHWEEIEVVRTVDDPRYFERFRNNATGEIMNSDPRPLSDALKKRGVNVQTFQLV